jgi:hypothetical protein
MGIQITDSGIIHSGGTTTFQEIENANNLIALTVNFKKPDYDKALFLKAGPSSIVIPAGTQVLVGSTAVEVAANVTLDLNTNLDTGAKTAGTDYYVYAKADSTFYISADKTITADRLVGGFHYGLIPEAEAPTGNKTESDMVKIRGINAYSMWDLKFRPNCNPEGMVYINGKWYDIYLLNSEHIANGTSKAGAFIAAGAASYGRLIPKIPLMYGGDGTLTYGKLTWFQLCEIAASHGKKMIGYDEFPTIAYGVTEGKSSSTDGYETVAGKVEHYPHLTSKFGIEQAAGVQYVWGKDLMNGYGTTTFVWVDYTDTRGQIYATSSSPTAVRLGGDRGNGANAGSRCSNWGSYVWYSNWNVGSRFACDHLKLV